MHQTSTVLITGASKGIGRALAHVFAEQGHNLILIARSEDKLLALKEELASTHGVTVHTRTQDLTLPQVAQTVFDWTKSEEITIDILVNNAGFGGSGSFAESDWPFEERMITLNITALTHLTDLYVREMVARGSGKILNVASTAAFMPGPNMAVYFATKAYVLHFSEALATELAETGVYVTTLCPGITKTEFQEVANMTLSKRAELGAMSPREVALAAYTGLMRHQDIVIPGVMNWFISFAVRFLPRRTVRRLVQKFM